MFSILPRNRNVDLLRLLVAYEIIWDFLDNVNERTASVGIKNGLQLHRALVDAIDLTRPISDYYKHIPTYDDSSYLYTLVAACRRNCAALPSYGRVRTALVREAVRGMVCALNHDLDPIHRDARLKAWAATESAATGQALWFELTGAASTNLTVFALLALASEAACSDDAITRASHAYFPWISVLTSMLDSYVDQFDDASSGNHSYIAHYPTPQLAIKRMRRLIRRCLAEASSLDQAERHIVIAGCMFAMYLSRDTAMAPGLRTTTMQLIQSGGSLTRFLYPILKFWRMVYGLRSV